MKAPELVKAIDSHMFWHLNLYFDRFEIDSARGVIFGIGGSSSNPKYTLEDFCFNEAAEWDKVKETFGEGVKTYEVKAVNWNPIFK